MLNEFIDWKNNFGTMQLRCRARTSSSIPRPESAKISWNWQVQESSALERAEFGSGWAWGPAAPSRDFLHTASNVTKIDRHCTPGIWGLEYSPIAFSDSTDFRLQGLAHPFDWSNVFKAGFSRRTWIFRGSSAIQLTQMNNVWQSVEAENVDIGGKMWLPLKLEQVRLGSKLSPKLNG